MKPGKTKLLLGAFGIAVLILGVWGLSVWAADSGGAASAGKDSGLAQLIQTVKTHLSRDIWDLIMRWVNFLILAAIIIKYGRAPLASFIVGKRAETARAIKLIEEQKRLADEKVKEGQIKLKASEDHLQLIHDRIVSEGQRQKLKLIETAKQESRTMMEAANTKISGQIRDARQTIRNELIEAATDRALEKLPQLITDKDHDRMIHLWMEESER